MPSLGAAECRERLALADHGVLATVGAGGHPHAVPVCFALVDDHVVVPVDDVKPKSTPRLQRARNLARTRQAALLVEHWDAHDWSRLWWVRADLVADAGAAAAPPERFEAAGAALRERYPQYHHATFAALSVLRIGELVGWSGS